MVYWFLTIAAIIVAVLFLKKRSQATGNQLPVLMYHKISKNGDQDFMTLPAIMLERQFHHLKKSGYTPIRLSQLTEFILNKKKLPEKPVLITFDDGYRDNYTVLYPLLKEYGIVANIFLVPSFISENNNQMDTSGNEFLSKSDIKSMDHEIVEFGLHSFDHKNYGSLSPIELNEDINQCRAMLKKLDIPFQHSIAFPYGAYPKRDRKKRKFFLETLAFNNIVTAFRIGNRLNLLPLKNPLLIQRIDIRGDISLDKFARLLKKGKSNFS